MVSRDGWRPVACRPVLPKTGAIKLLDGTVNRHATMMAYNDVFWLMGMLFILTIPCLVFTSGQWRGGAGSKIGYASSRRWPMAPTHKARANALNRMIVDPPDKVR